MRRELLPILAVTVLISCQREETVPASEDRTIFRDVTTETGLEFRHFNGMSGEFYMVEITGAGAGLLDYDNDGDLDVYLVQGGKLAPGRGRGATPLPPDSPNPMTDRLYRNDLEIRPDGARRLRFVDVTAESGLVASEYGMGVATGDFDKDGFVDLYITNYGPNQLWHNDGDGTFSDVTEASATGESRWSTGAAFLDYDQDGWLDLYVVNYVDLRLENNLVCRSASSRRDYCGPQNFPAVPDRLFHNQGDGTFEDRSGALGILKAAGKGFGVVTGDFDGNGWIDLYVANDGELNLLWLNQEGQRFEDGALLRGCALNGEGRAEASMGVEAGDLDGDGDEDLFSTHLRAETNTIYLNDGNGFFQDATHRVEPVLSSLPFVGFGTAFLDFDNDGWLDIATVNGSVVILNELASAGDPFPLHQRNQLYRNLGGARFEEVPPEKAGSGFLVSEVSRGAAMGDLDNDGDSDLLITNNHGPARLLLNETGNAQSWLGLRLVDEQGLDVPGALVRLTFSDGARRWQRVRTDSSYCSARDPRLLFGLAKRDGIVRIQAEWPGGSPEEWDTREINRYLTLRRGSGRAARTTELER